MTNFCLFRRQPPPQKGPSGLSAEALGNFFAPAGHCCVKSSHLAGAGGGGCYALDAPRGVSRLLNKLSTYMAGLNTPVTSRASLVGVGTVCHTPPDNVTPREKVLQFWVFPDLEYLDEFQIRKYPKSRNW